MKKYLTLLIVIFISFQANAEANNKYGRFIGNFDFRALEDGRKLKLLNDLVFIDPKGKKWVAPKGHIVDGASIPRALWTVVGSPLVGKYRMASVIHDVACDEKKRPWKEVHKVFHYAMLASGVSPDRANLMYNAVYDFGPRWGKDAEKKLSKKDIEKMINTQYFKNTFSDVKKINSNLKNYSGTGAYIVTKKENSSLLFIKKKNDLSAFLEIGNGKPEVTVIKSTKKSSFGVSVGNGKPKVTVIMSTKRSSFGASLGGKEGYSFSFSSGKAETSIQSEETKKRRREAIEKF